MQNKESMENTKKRLKKCDWLIWIALVMMLIVKFSTMFMISMIHEETGAEIESVALRYEANDLFKMEMSLLKMSYILVGFILPAGGIALYYYIKRKVRDKKVDLTTLEFFVSYTFFILLINVVNDGANLLGMLAR